MWKVEPNTRDQMRKEIRRPSLIVSPHADARDINRGGKSAKGPYMEATGFQGANPFKGEMKGDLA